MADNSTREEVILDIKTKGVPQLSADTEAVIAAITKLQTSLVGVGEKSEKANEKVSVLGQGLKVFGGFSGPIGEVAGAFGKVESAVNLGTKAMNFLRLGIISTGIGILVVALGAVVAYFTETFEGSKKLQVVLGGLGGVVNAVIQSFAGLGKILKGVGESVYGLFTADPSMIMKGINDISEASKEMGKNISEAYSAGSKEAEREIALAKKRRDLVEQDLEDEMNEAKRKAQIELKNSDQSAAAQKKRAEAVKDAEAAINKYYKAKSYIDNEELAIELEKQKRMGSTYKDLDKLAKLKGQSDDAEKTRILDLEQLKVKSENKDRASDQRKETAELRKKKLAEETAALYLALETKLTGLEKESHEKRLRLLEESNQKEIAAIKSKGLKIADEVKLLALQEQIYQKEISNETIKAQKELYDNSNKILSDFYKDKRALLDTEFANGEITDKEFKAQELADNLEQANTLLTVAQNTGQGIVDAELAIARAKKAIRDEDIKEADKAAKEIAKIEKNKQDAIKAGEKELAKDVDKIANNLVKSVLDGYKREEKAAQEKFDREKKRITDEAKLQIEAIKKTEEFELNTYDLTAAQKTKIHMNAAAKEKKIADKAKADELQAQKELDAKKKQIAKKQAEVQFEIASAKIVADTAVAIVNTMSQFGYPWGLIPAGLMAGMGIYELSAANEQKNNVQSLGDGTIDEHGIVQGPLHKHGGVKFNSGRVELEGGEGVLSRRAMQMDGIKDAVFNVNNAAKNGAIGSFSNTRIQPSTALSKSVITDKFRDHGPVKVYVLEKDITEKQGKVKDIVSRSIIG
jgi:hypothetical protein